MENKYMIEWMNELQYPVKELPKNLEYTDCLMVLYIIGLIPLEDK